MLLIDNTSAKNCSLKLRPPVLTFPEDQDCDRPDLVPQVFDGIGDWPDIDERLADRSVQLITQHGVKEWALAGGILRPDGLPTFGSPSSEAFHIVREIVATDGCFSCCDNVGLNWAVQITGGRSKSAAKWQGIALGLFSSATTMLDPGWRNRAIQLLNTRISELANVRSRFESSGANERSCLSVLLASVKCADAAMKLVPWLVTMANLEGSQTLTVAADELATVLWGDNQLYWPTDCGHAIFEAISWLGMLQVQRLQLHKTGWCPEPQERGSAVRSVRWINEHSLVIRLDPSFISFTNTWLRRCATEQLSLITLTNDF